MGIYYHYVNHTRREVVDLSSCRQGGDKENAALICTPVLGWLMRPSYSPDRLWEGAWRGGRVEIVNDAGAHTSELEPAYNTEDRLLYHEGEIDYRDIGAEVVAEMRREAAFFFDRLWPWWDEGAEGPHYPERTTEEAELLNAAWKYTDARRTGNAEAIRGAEAALIAFIHRKPT